MANKKVLITSRGCYAVDPNGVTVELENGKESSITDTQADVFLRSGKAQLVINAPVQAPTTPSKQVKKSK
tara:strand:- start:271 stop:480 length:210 start_codon:yes stop_codon:yes gene_type:complete